MKTFKEFMTESKNRAKELKKILEGPDFGMTTSGSGGNGVVKSKGGNIIVYDSFFAGSDRALQKIKSAWSPKGHYYEYFAKEHNMVIKIVGEDIAISSKIFKGSLGHVAVELSVN